MWKVGQWYRFSISQTPVRYYCEYVAENGDAFLRVERSGDSPHVHTAAKVQGLHNGSMWDGHYIPCEPPEWAVMEYDPTQQEDNENDI